MSLLGVELPNIAVFNEGKNHFGKGRIVKQEPKII
jgi:hypothetical protein